MWKTILLYSVILIAGIFLLQWMKVGFITGGLSFEVYLTIVAVFFLIIGIVVARNRNKIPEENAELAKPSDFQISPREYEVLVLMAEGLSNEEIADRLHVSLSTVKTHGYNLFKKLEVSKRTKAIAKAKVLRLIK